MPSPSKKPAEPLPNEPLTRDSATASGAPDGNSLLQRHPWIPFVLPLAVFLLLTQLEPTRDRPGGLLGLEIPYSAYPLVYAIKLALVVFSMALVWPGYTQFAWRMSLLAPAVGVIGAILWVGICKLQLEARVSASLGLDWFSDAAARSAFNPLAEMADRPALAYAFLALRLLGLVVVVPIIE